MGETPHTSNQALSVVYAVVYSNYDPAEVDSLWTTRERAEERASELGEGWTAANWQVKE